MQPIGAKSAPLSAAHYLQRPPEALAMNGYRNWLLGLMQRDEARFRKVWLSHNDALGQGLSRLAMEGMHALVSQLESCSRCPLRFLSPFADHFCQDEGLVLGLISGLHNGNDDLVWKCASKLACPRMSDQLIGASGQYAMSLKAGGKTLMPLPEEIFTALMRGEQSCDHAHTLH
ncbi:MAG: hypothetical protein AAGG69_11970 [Pseudomonadota bacterium]